MILAYERQRQRQSDLSKTEASLDYRPISKMARAMQRNRVLEEIGRAHV